jgi:hypothetical protein
MFISIFGSEHNTSFLLNEENPGNEKMIDFASE